MRAAVLLAALLLARCLGEAPAPGVSERVVGEAFDRAGAPWLAQQVALCGFCGPQPGLEAGLEHAIILFGDGRLVLVDFNARQGEGYHARENVTFDAAQLDAALDPESLREVWVVGLRTARLEDRRVLDEARARWAPDAGRDACADYAETFRFAPEGRAPERVDRVCPVEDGEPIQEFADLMARLKEGVRAAGAPQGLPSG